MRVLVISPTFPPMRSGGADHAFRICQYLAKRKVEIHVMTSRIENIVADPNMRIYPVMEDWSWAELPRLLQLARRYQPDVINIHFSGGIYADQPMITFAPTLLKKALPNVRIVTLVEYPEPVYVQRLSRVARIGRKLAAYWVGPRDVDYGYGTILRDSDRIIVLSDTHVSVLAKHFARVRDKCVLIPPPPLMQMSSEHDGAARLRGREMLGLASDDFLVAYFGYLYPGKGIETLLRGFQTVAERKSNVKIVFIGDANEVILNMLNRPNYLKELKDLVRDLGLDDKVIWTGYYPVESDLASIYLRAADTCVLPFDDGVMLNRSSFAGAVAHGLPTITTQGEILEAPFRHNENVLLCKPKDPDSLAAALDSLIIQPQLRHQLSCGALSMAREWFSWDGTVERTMEAFGYTS
jgi:polysaccharide biosynthesis protein PslF